MSELTGDAGIKRRPRETFLEIYEERFWEAEQHAGILDSGVSCRTVGDWDEWLHQRRRRDWTDPELGDPRPLDYSFEFVKTAATGTIEYLYYINPWVCAASGAPRHGVIAIVDDVQ